MFYTLKVNSSIVLCGERLFIDISIRSYKLAQYWQKRKKKGYKCVFISNNETIQDEITIELYQICKKKNRNIKVASITKQFFHNKIK